MIKIKQMIKEVYTRLLLLNVVQEIYNRLKNNLDCSIYLFDMKLPVNVYKKVMFNKNTNINTTSNFFKTSVKRTPLQYACVVGNILKVKLLLTHPDIDVNYNQNSEHVSALNEEKTLSNTEIVKLLLAHPDIDVNIKDNWERTPLINSCKEAAARLIILLLLAHPKIDVNVRDYAGRTALLYAVWMYNLDIVKLLLKIPKLDVNIKSNSGDTAIDYTNSPLIQEIIKNHPSYKG